MAYCPALPGPAGLPVAPCAEVGDWAGVAILSAGPVTASAALACAASTAEPSAPGCGMTEEEGAAEPGILPPLAATQAANCAGGTACTAIGMKAWRAPHSSE